MNKSSASDKITRESIRGDIDTLAQLSSRSELNIVARDVAAQYRDDSISPNMVAGVLRGIDFTIVFLSGLAAYAGYVSLFKYLPVQHAAISLLGALFIVFAFEVAGLYKMRRLRIPVHAAVRMLAVWSVGLALFTITTFFLKISTDFSRVWAILWLTTAFSLGAITRFVTAFFIKRWARNGVMERRAVIVGGGSAAEDLIRTLEQQPFNDIRICGIFDDRDAARSPEIVAGYPKLGNVSELIEFARIAHIDMLIVTLPMTAESRVLGLLKKLWVLPVDIRLSAHNNQLRFRPRAYSYIGSVPMLDIFDRPINDWDSVAKRVFDVVFSVLGIIALSPIMLMIAIAIKLDSKGPVLFKQKRHGFNNEVTWVYKFRSMYTDQCDPTAVKAVTKGDPRVTRVGRIIRKTSLDELPQFFNALKGDLSLVGPRPHAVTAQANDRLFNEVVDGYFGRHRVKPGVTGWAQINGMRGEIDSDEKIRARTELDLHYIENWSLWFDLKILLLTPICLLNTENAY